jgi:hypothetical protein
MDWNSVEGSPSMLSTVLGVLALVGVLGILARLARAGLRLGITAAEAAAANGLAEASARRGDLTALDERRRQAAELRRTRRARLAVAAGWAALLVVPAFTPWGREAYAAASLLWLLPRARRRGVPPPGGAVQG